MDAFRIDSHKLMYHIERLHRWIKKGDIYPLYIEISPSGGCNQRCIFCALDYLGYKASILDTRVLKRFLKDIVARGVKSIMFAGEGEPLLHKDIATLIIYASNRGLDVAVTTNGVLLSRTLLEKILPHLSWLRVSLNAATAKTYARIHRTDSQSFFKVMANIKDAVNLKKKKKLSSTVGVQFLLLNENYKELYKLARVLKKTGVDYLIIKPYSQHPKSYNRLGTTLDYDKFSFFEDSLKKYEGKNFKIIFRKEVVLRLKEKKPYIKCLGLPFWSYLTSSGNLYACSAFLGDERFSYGNIYKEPFEKIWKGKKRKQVIRMMETTWRIENCRESCRLDAINRYLWELKNPIPHVNFI
jgi:radical SAM protein with 4Fe4S-binding SPASM domain